MIPEPIRQRVAVERRRAAHLLARQRQRRALAAIAPVTAWIEHIEPVPLVVSVVTPTRNRASVLRHAVASVQQQHHQAWELLVVDDGSEDDTPDLLASFDDARIRAIRTQGRGCAAARNVALNAATGDVVAYLDDDNVMHPLWLQAVAWAFASWSDVSSLYGARVMEGGEAVLGLEGGRLPEIHFVPFSRRLLRLANFIDIGAFAHRRGLPETRFNETLAQAADWDFVLRVTASADPLALPVVSTFYRTSGPDRLSARETAQSEFRAVAAMHRRTDR